MYKQHNKSIQQGNTQQKTTTWVDSVDLELIFMNSIAICVVLLAIVIADVVMT